MAFDVGEVLLTVIKNFVNLLPVRIVHSYEQGVKFSFGKDKVLLKKPRMYFYIPFFQKIEILDIRYDGVDLANMSLETSDNIPITLSGYVIFRIRNARACYNNVGDIVEVKKLLEMRGRGELSGIAWKYSYNQIKERKPMTLTVQEEKKELELALIKVTSKGVSADLEESITPSYEGNGGDEDEDERATLPRKGVSELEQKVREELHKKVTSWGISVYDFSITDSLKTKGYRFYGDTIPLDV